MVILEIHLLTVSQLFAIKLKGVECKDSSDMGNAWDLLTNEWFNGGFKKFDNGRFSWVQIHSKNTQDYADTILGHCRESQADTAFMFMTAVVVIVCALLVWLRMRKGY